MVDARSPRFRLLVLLPTAALLCRPAGTHAQTNYPTGSTSSSSSSTHSTSGYPSPLTRSYGDEVAVDPNFSHRQLVARREELKRRMVDTAARILMLTHDLETELETREPVEADAKRLDEIAKLARAVRDGMKQ